MAEIGVLGAGTWGLASARMLSLNGHRLTVWSALPDEIEQLDKERIHRNLLGMRIPEEIAFTKELSTVCSKKDFLLFAVPFVFVRSTAKIAREFIDEGQIIVDVAKGVEPGTLYTMTQVIRDELKKLVKLVGFIWVNSCRRSGKRFAYHDCIGL